MIAGCRICGSEALDEVLDLGEVPLANALLASPEEARAERRYPLRTVVCPRCSLVQLDTTVPPELLFTDYPYSSSVSASISAHGRRLAESVLARHGDSSPELVVEIASNDGYLLETYVRAGVPVLGIDPARNLAAAARERGVETVVDFFSADLARRLTDDGLRAAVIHANNVLAHVADTRDFVAGIRTLLAPNGAAIIEFPYLLDLVERTEFDTIYHEHLCYFSLTAVRRLFDEEGLEVRDVERIPIHGGSLRVTIGHQDTAGAPSPAVSAMIRREAEWGVADPESYRPFREAVTAVCTGLGELVSELVRDGATVAAYGASAKGATLLNVATGVADHLSFVVDKSPLKQGRYTPGTHLPIVGPEKIAEAPPDYLLLLAWNLADEIMHQETAYREAGGRFIVPVPEPRVA